MYACMHVYMHASVSIYICIYYIFYHLLSWIITVGNLGKLAKKAYCGYGVEWNFVGLTVWLRMKYVFARFFPRSSTLQMQVRTRCSSAPASTALPPICTSPTPAANVTLCRWRTSCSTVQPTLFSGWRRRKPPKGFSFWVLWRSNCVVLIIGQLLT